MITKPYMILKIVDEVFVDKYSNLDEYTHSSFNPSNEYHLSFYNKDREYEEYNYYGYYFDKDGILQALPLKLDTIYTYPAYNKVTFSIPDNEDAWPMVIFDDLSSHFDEFSLYRYGYFFAPKVDIGDGVDHIKFEIGVRLAPTDVITHIMSDYDSSFLIEFKYPDIFSKPYFDRVFAKNTILNVEREALKDLVVGDTEDFFFELINIRLDKYEKDELRLESSI